MSFNSLTINMPNFSHILRSVSEKMGKFMVVLPTSSMSLTHAMSTSTASHAIAAICYKLSYISG
jgi:hypothetical protein